jgi:hypothetical protein
MFKFHRMDLDTLVNKNEYDIWYFGIMNTVDDGLKNLYAHLKKKGETIVEITDIFDALEQGQINYCVVYRSLPNLEYLEYMWEKRVGNNGKKTL